MIMFVEIFIEIHKEKKLNKKIDEKEKKDEQEISNKKKHLKNLCSLFLMKRTITLNLGKKTKIFGMMKIMKK